MKKIFACLTCLFVILSLCACVTVKEDTQKNGSATNQGSPEEIKTEFAIGETWTVEGQWSLTVLGATETEERNQYSDVNPGAVYIVDYVYTNDGYEDSIMDGLYISLDDMIVDAKGAMGYSYPGDVTNYPKETPVGATCHAQTCIGVDNPGTFTITVNTYDSNSESRKATFVVDPTKPLAEYKAPTGTKNSNASALKIGETWTVDGQWTLTIDGVTSIEERNEYSDQNPAAVYIVDYTYKNLGYENSFMDGLYFSLEDTIVDANGKMGYSYPGDITNYPQETPVGATCSAQVCIGVDNAGPFTLTVTQYDGNEQKQSQTFLVEP